jgi:ribosomal protein L15
MRYFHKTNNKSWKPTINIDKLWSLVPLEEKEGLTEDSDVVPVIDTLHHGYGKVLGNGQCVYPIAEDATRLLTLHWQAPQTPLHCEGTFRLQDC